MHFPIQRRPRATESVSVVLTPFEQDALLDASQYLVGFGRILGFMEPARCKRHGRRESLRPVRARRR